MRRLAILLLCAQLLFAADTGALAGFSTDSARAQREWEAKFRAIPDTANLRAYMMRLAARPHPIGSAYGKDNAEWILGKFREWGLEANIETFDVLFPTPKQRVLEMVEPTRFTAKLVEPPVAGDATSAQQQEQLPTYNAYSIDGDVTAPLVYVNFGVPDDYETLERMGVSVKGAIVIARYGGSWRGIKPKVAAEHGAVGCIIYSDPHEDGYFQGDVFPAGPYRPKDGAQRGSVMDMPVYPGDPLTPGAGATPGTPRLARSEAVTLTRIPVLPISYGDAQPLLEALKGQVAPAAWRGALPMTYHIGPGPAKVHLKLAFNWDTKTAYNVIARIPGAQYPDEWVIRGNHHDAWVNGADDPVSAANATMEEARGLAALVKQGWRPKRTIIYCLWDGEEPGLLGSTEWAEAHDAELRAKAVAYINSDSNGRGFLEMSGSHTLERFMNGVAKDIDDPETGVSAWKRLQAGQLARASGPAAQQVRGRADLRIGALGSGSDYTAFLDHLGVPSVNLSFGGLDDGGVYHSIYDDIFWYTSFSDKDFTYGRALAQTGGTAVMRLASAELLPFDFDNFSETVRRYVDEVQQLARAKRDQALERNRLIDDGVFRLTDDPRRPMKAPQKEPVPPYLNFAPLDNGVEALQRVAEAYREAVAKTGENGGTALTRAALRDVNAKLIAVERALTLKEGLPGRPWFQHQIYAPGFYTGYGVKTLPAVRESIEQKDWKQAEESIVKVGKVLENAGETIQSAAAELTRSLR
jgi:N-acetylated-alpha-linked acidic dipeptidase